MKGKGREEAFALYITVRALDNHAIYSLAFGAVTIDIDNFAH